MKEPFVVYAAALLSVRSDSILLGVLSFVCMKI